MCQSIHLGEALEPPFLMVSQNVVNILAGFSGGLLEICIFHPIDTATKRVIVLDKSKSSGIETTKLKAIFPEGNAMGNVKSVYRGFFQCCNL